MQRVMLGFEDGYARNAGGSGDAFILAHDAHASGRRIMQVKDYLAAIKRVIITCRPEDTIETAATLLATNHIGAMPVRDADGRIVGMFSERDIIRAFSQRGREVQRLLVGDLMSTALIVCTPDDAMVTARRLMKANRIRHLLVMQDRRLVGLLSISDVLEVILRDTDMEVHVLRDHVIAVRGM